MSRCHAFRPYLINCRFAGGYRSLAFRGPPSGVVWRPLTLTVPHRIACGALQRGRVTPTDIERWAGCNYHCERVRGGHCRVCRGRYYLVPSVVLGVLPPFRREFIIEQQAQPRVTGVAALGPPCPSLCPCMSVRLRAWACVQRGTMRWKCVCNRLCWRPCRLGSVVRHVGASLALRRVPHAAAMRRRRVTGQASFTCVLSMSEESFAGWTARCECMRRQAA